MSFSFRKSESLHSECNLLLSLNTFFLSKGYICKIAQNVSLDNLWNVNEIRIRTMTLSSVKLQSVSSLSYNQIQSAILHTFPEFISLPHSSMVFGRSLLFSFVLIRRSHFHNGHRYESVGCFLSVLLLMRG